MQTLYVYHNQTTKEPITNHEYYLTGYHETPIKIGDMVKLSISHMGMEHSVDVYKVLAIKQQWWNGDNNPVTDPDKYTLAETIPSYKNWLKLKPLSEIREEKINGII